MRFWRRAGELGKLEAELLSHRPQPEAKFERELIDRLAARPARRSAGYRMVLATAMSTCVVASLAAFGGVSYAVQAVQDAVTSNPTSTTSSATAQYAEGTCVEYVNPHGATIPPAGQTSPGTNPKSGQNPDGFYQIGSSDGSQVYVIDTGTGKQFGPYPSGTVIKYTEANGATPTYMTIGSTTGQAGAVTVHIIGQGDPAVQLVTGGPLTICYVPPPPK
jgi:hypothetical protein